MLLRTDEEIEYAQYLKRFKTTEHHPLSVRGEEHQVDDTLEAY